MRATLLHLRFPFVLVLAPLYVWGAWRAPGAWTGATTLGFLLVHLALYPGANAFNSAYDEDEGPIGGMARPPELPRDLAAGSTLLQASGAALAPLVGWTFALGYVALWAIFTAYSHPRTRWKRDPLASTSAIALGQGGIGFLLGWTAAGGGLAALVEPSAAWALLAAVAIVTALYPWTQAYQVEADAARGERTLAAALGTRGTCAWSGTGLAVAAVAAARLGLDLVVGYLGALVAIAVAAACLIPRGWRPPYRVVMGVVYVNSVVWLIFLATYAT